MGARTGERVGWLAGWSGGFLWVVVLGVVFLVQERTAAGLAGVALVVAGMGAAWLARPWSHPGTTYRTLMLAPLAVLAATVPWAVLGFGLDALRQERFLPWALLPLAGAFLAPLLTVGPRRWRDGDPGSGGTG